MAEHAHTTTTPIVDLTTPRKQAEDALYECGVITYILGKLATLAACADYLRIQRAWETYCARLDCDVENDDPNLSMLDPIPALEERIVALRATTAEGHVARARCMALGCLPNHRIAQDDPTCAMEDRFQAALYRDLIAQERPEMQTGRV